MLTGPLPVRRERARVAQRVHQLLGGGDATAVDRPADEVGGADGLHPGAVTSALTVAQLVPEVGARLPGAGLRRSFRVDPGRHGAAAIGAAAVVAAVVTGVWVFSSRPQSIPVAGPSALAGTASGSASAASTPLKASSPGAAVLGATSPGAASPAASPSSVASVVVDVAGRVVRPGLYTLPAGARVDDAVRAAGGPMSGVSLTTLNLALKVSDGEQIVVGVAGLAPISGSSVAPGAGTASGGPAALVNLNSATLEQLETLPGIGPALGQRILDWRAAHGGFTAITQLNDVSGVGDVRYAQLRPLVSL